MGDCTRRDFLATMALSAGLLPVAQAAGSRPNVIVILTDDQGYGDAGVNGNDKIRTPNLDRFAEQGVRFSRFYCSPVCAPTRASLMTGRYYYRTGVIHTSRGGAKMHGDEVTLAELLGRAGYATGIFGKWHLGDNYPMRPQDQGFAECLVHRAGGIGQAPDKPNSYFDPVLWHNGRRFKADGYCTDAFTDAAMRFIESRRDQPFFVYLPLNAPHTPLDIDATYYEPYKALGLDDTTAKVYGMISNIDDNIGRLLARLDELGLRENTLIFFLGDNGPQQERYTAGLRGRKSSVYEGGIRVPCFAQWPKGFPGGRRIGRIAAHIDVAPTLLDACGIEVPEGLALDGASLMPLLRDPQTAWPDRRLFFQCHRGLTPKPYQNCAVMTGRYKMVGGPGTFKEDAYTAPDKPVLELYDIDADPGEQHDLAKRHPEILAKLRKEYDAWFVGVKRTRQFTPGVIHIGSDFENPSHLCRYQDSAYVDGKPTGWPVYIEKAGQYESTIDRGTSSVRAQMHVRLDGKRMMRPLDPNQNRAIFTLPEGDAMLDVWVQEENRPRVVHTKNDTTGDVTIKRLGVL